MKSRVIPPNSGTIVMSTFAVVLCVLFLLQGHG